MGEPGTGGGPEPVVVEVLDDGRGPERRPRRVGPHGGLTPWRTDRARRLLGAGAVAALAVAVIIVARPTTGERAPARPSASGPAGPAGPAGTRAEAVQLLDDQDSYSASRGDLTLQLDVVNYGLAPIQVLRTRLPQAGSRPVPGPGGDLPFSDPVTLAPGTPTPVTVTARVSCPAVLTAELADHVDVTLGLHGEPQRVLSLSLAPLGPLLDEARHQACGALSASAAVYPTMVQGSVHPQPASPSGSRVIQSELSVKNVSLAPLTVVVGGVAPAGVTVTSRAGTAPLTVPLTVPAGQTRSIPLAWNVQDCAALAAVRWPTLALGIRTATSTADDVYGFDSVFGAEWAAALRVVCSP